MIEKIVVCDSTYSFFFSDLAEKIETIQENEISKVSLSSFFSEQVFLSNFEMVKVNFEENWLDVVNTVKGIISLANLSGDLSGFELESISRYFLGLENYISHLDRDKTVFFIYNDLRWDHSLIVHLCKQYNIEYFVFELGVFRPNSLTVDKCGVNARSDFSKLKFNGEHPITPPIELDEIYNRQRTTPRFHEFKFALYMLMKSIELQFSSKELKAIQRCSRRKSYKDYIKLKLKKMFVGNVLSKKVNDIDGEYIFVPLQLSNDTQTIVNSEFTSTQEFIDRVTLDFFNSSLCDKFKLVFKVHPMDVNSYNFDQRTMSSSISTEELVRKSSAVVTINSTVGFEASSTKPVICCGDSFYTQHGVVHKADLNSNIFDSAFDVMLNYISSPLYRYFVLENYQLPGGMYNYDDLDIDYSAHKILGWCKDEK